MTSSFTCWRNWTPNSQTRKRDDPDHRRHPEAQRQPRRGAAIARIEFGDGVDDDRAEHRSERQDQQVARAQQRRRDRDHHHQDQDAPDETGVGAVGAQAIHPALLPDHRRLEQRKMAGSIGRCRACPISQRPISWRPRTDPSAAPPGMRSAPRPARAAAGWAGSAGGGRRGRAPSPAGSRRPRRSASCGADDEAGQPRDAEPGDERGHQCLAAVGDQGPARADRHLGAVRARETATAR